MTKFFASLFRMLTTFVNGTEEIAEAYGSVCRTARIHATAFEKESSIEAEAKIKELERKLNTNNAIEHQA